MNDCKIPRSYLFPNGIFQQAIANGYSSDFFNILFEEVKIMEEKFDEGIMTCINKGYEDTAFIIYSLIDHIPKLEDGLKIMCVAAKHGLVLLIRNLIEYGVPPIEVDSKGKTAVHYAMEGHRVNAIKILMPYYPFDRADIKSPYQTCANEEELNTLLEAGFPNHLNVQPLEAEQTFWNEFGNLHS